MAGESKYYDLTLRCSSAVRVCSERRNAVHKLLGPPAPLLNSTEGLTSGAKVRKNELQSEQRVYLRPFRVTFVTLKRQKNGES